MLYQILERLVMIFGLVFINRLRIDIVVQRLSMPPKETCGGHDFFIGFDQLWPYQLPQESKVKVFDSSRILLLAWM